MIKFISFYQILIWLYFGVVSSIDLHHPDVRLFSLAFVSKMIVLCISALMIYSNLFLLLKKGDLRTHLIINKWSNFVQTINLSLIGFNFILIVGIHIVLYYSFDTIQEVGAGYDVRFSMQINYVQSNKIEVGVSVIPMIIFIIFTRALNLYERDKESRVVNSVME